MARSGVTWSADPKYLKETSTMVSVSPSFSHDPVRALVLLGCFSRGVEATGPNQTMLGMARTLSPDIEFKVVAEAVPQDVTSKWQIVKGLPQLPIAAGLKGLRELRSVLQSERYDLLITNGFFDRRMTTPLLVMRRLGLVPRTPLLLAPHGEFSPGALGLGKARKQAYIAAMKAGSFLKDVVMQATSEEEADRIKTVIGPQQPIVVMPNLRAIDPLPKTAFAPSQTLRIVFASRIDRMKNLHLALEQAGRSGMPVQFDIFGPISDPDYWAEIEAMIPKLPSQITVSYGGVLKQSEVVEKIAEYDVMMLPSRGENFAYAVADALLAGVPVLLSDRTPWRGLEAEGVGWDRPLDHPDNFSAALREYHALPAPRKLAMRQAARRYAERKLGSNEDREQVRTALRSVIR